MPGDEVERRQRAFTEEVTSRFGVLPNFFCSAPAADELVQELGSSQRRAISILHFRRSSRSVYSFTCRDSARCVIASYDMWDF